MPTIAEANLIRLTKTTLVEDFVLAHHGSWNHQDWLDFCSRIEERGFTPVDLDKVGLLLEQKKAEYWSNGGKFSK